MKTILGLREKDCRYITGRDKRGAIYCAEVQTARSSYCAEHEKLCFIGGRARARMPIHLPIDPVKPREWSSHEPTTQTDNR